MQIPKHRNVDPKKTVTARLDRLRGVRTQADTDAELRDQRRFGAGRDALKRILEFPTVIGKLTIRKTSDDAFAVVNDEDQTQVLIGTQTGPTTNTQPVLLIGPEITDLFTYKFKVFGDYGHINAEDGFVQTSTHHFAKFHSGVRHDAGATTLTTIGTTAWTADAPTDDSTTVAPWGRWTTSAALGDARGPNGPLAYLSPWKAEAFFRISMSSDITSQRVWVGLFSADPSGSSTPNLHFAGFRYVAGTDTTWRAYTGDGANRTNEDTTIAVQASTSYNLRVRLTSTQAQLIIGLPGVNDGFVNGTWTRTITTTLPSTTQLLAPYVRITNLAASSRWIRFSHANFLQF